MAPSGPSWMSMGWLLNDAKSRLLPGVMASRVLFTSTVHMPLPALSANT